MAFTKEGNHYNNTLALNDTPAKLVVGGNLPDKFVPNINGSKWDDECWLNINFPQVVTTEQANLADGIISQTVGDITHKFYITPDGHLEFELVIARKPKTNIFSLSLDFSDGLTFFYQDTLENDWQRWPGEYTLEEFLAIHERPENIVGSYAVYWAPSSKIKKHNEYKTGKFCHIYRPKFIDADGKSIWASQHIDPVAKTWTITVDAQWLQTATYPIRLDPEIGYHTDGGTALTVSDYICACRFACGTTGTTASAKLYAYLQTTSGTSLAIGGVYQNNAGTVSGQSKLSSSEVEFAVANALAWQPVAGQTLTPPAFQSGTDYWLALNTDNNARIRYDTVTAGYEDFEYKSRTYDSTLPATFPTGLSSAAYEFSIYVDYTAAGGLSIPVAMRSYRNRRIN